MYLKSIQLQGFKSFHEKVKLDFDKGITAVVGPNGSGKSNISDAARWVLGEQRIKSLRGEKMEDIIFAGTQNRKPLGYAEVNLILDNSEEDFKLDCDYSEVSIKRRVYRSGESDYFINGSACRLKDINELFMDTGVGRDGYSIIGQGRVEEILSNKSEEKRMLFEEASGISKYKHRRNDALSNIEKKKQDLLRLNDIISDLEEKLGPLEKQAKNAREYLELSEELKKVELNLFVFDLEKSEKKINELSSKLNINKDTLSSLSTDLIASKELLNEIKEKVERKENDLDENKKTSNLQDILSEKEKNNVNIKNEQLLNLSDRKIRLKNQITESLDEYNKIDLDYKKNKDLLEKAIDSFDEKKSKLLGFEKYYAEKNQKIKNLEINLNQNKEEELKNIRIKNEKEREFELIKLRLEQNKEEVLALKSNIDRGEEEKKFDENKFEELNCLIEKLEKEEDILNHKIEELKKEKDEFKNELMKNEKMYNNLHREKNDKEVKLKILKEMINEKDGFYSSVKEALKLKNKGLSGIHAALAELLKVDKKLEKSIEIALASNMQTIVVDKEETAKKAIDYLRKNKLGRASFISLNSVRENKLYDRKILEEDKVLGLASDLIECDEVYRKLIESFLGRTIIVEDIDVAVKLSKKYFYKYRLVSLEGDIISPAGIITGGSLRRKTFNIFSREDDYEKLKEELSTAKIKMKKRLEIIESNKIDMDKKTAEIKTLYKEIEDLKLGKSLNIQKAEQISKKLNKNSLEEKEKVSRIISLESEEKFYKTKVEILSEDIKVFAKKTIELESKNVKYESKLKNAKIIKDEDIDKIMNLKSEISALEESNFSLKNYIKRLKEDLFKKNAEQKKWKDEIKDIMQDKEEKNKEIKDSQNKTLDLEKYKLSLEEKYKEISLNLKSIKDKLQNLENSIVDKKDVLSSIEKENFKYDFEHEKLSDERRRLFDYIWNKYEITINMAREYKKLEFTYKELKDLDNQYSDKIKKLGYINLHAIDEFVQSQDKYKFLTKQKGDIILAEEKLKELITELTVEMEKQFKEQFYLISENFSSVFSEMFEGGQAYLKLMDEDNVLESDIEIIASPPGKRLQNMMLLSGGEKALTAISLLFAILKLRPSPFCILDEIEAALDDNNVRRFSKFLKGFAKSTQFIIITHRKQTMESADVLYGVTMEEMGVSKIISLELEDKVV